MSLPYDLAYAVGAIVSSPIWASRMLRTGKWRTDWPARFGHGPSLPRPPETPARPRLMLHAVSVGEVNAIRELVAQLARQQPAPEIVISTTTDTGVARARQLWEGTHPIVRYPFDFTLAVRRLLDRVQPDAVALTELEVWPNFVAECERRGIPVCVVNGRLSARSFAGYQRIGRLLRPTFARLSAAAVQTPAYAERFEALGVPSERVHVLDTMKWDTAKLADEVAGADALAQAMGIDRSKPLIVAGSTGPGEERLLTQVCWEGAQLVLVPRKPERFEEVARLDSSMIRRTQHSDGTSRMRDDTQLVLDGDNRFLIDTMGELRKAYALADVAVVGRSFNGLGGSDPIEPIALGKPTVIGPDHANFADVVEAFEQGGGILVVRGADELRDIINALLADPQLARALAEAGRAVIREHQGSTQRHVELLTSLLAKR